VARAGVDEARQKLHDVVIVDTAGRLGVDADMMEQARQIRRAIVPNEVLFVIDAMIGQDAVNTATAFDEGVNFTGIVLSKLDGDARGGAALSVSSVTGKPVMFASTGESLDDFELFHPDRMASRILDMGDVLSLIEQAEKSWDKDEAARMAKKFADQEDFTLDDFPRPDAADPQNGLHEEDAHDDARCAEHPAAAGAVRRARDRPGGGHCPLDDPA
jgi:signal recognition particle subunit SRP54